jgi:16S rRNA G966 N2-methylase RsmD
MANKSHFNSGHMAINQLKKNGVLHSSTITGISTPRTVHGVFIQDAVYFLKALPDSSVQLILIDPPYNLDLISGIASITISIGQKYGWIKFIVCYLIQVTVSFLVASNIRI